MHTEIKIKMQMPELYRRFRYLIGQRELALTFLMMAGSIEHYRYWAKSYTFWDDEVKFEQRLILANLR